MVSIGDRVSAKNGEIGVVVQLNVFNLKDAVKVHENLESGKTLGASILIP